MSIELKVPALGESISEAIIAQWFKSAGDAVSQDEIVLELETDKINHEVRAPEAGTLTSISGAEGDTVAVGDVLAVLKPGAAAPTSNGETAPAQSPASEAKASSASQDVDANADVLPPAVRRLVSENNLDPAQITGSGKGGRLTKGDVLEHLEAKKATPAAVKAPTPSAPGATRPTAEKRVERVRMSPLRRTIARRLVQAQQEAAMLTTFNEVDMSAIKALRATYQERFVKRYGHKVGFMSFFIKAVIEGLKAYPGLNAEIDDDAILYKYHYDIGVAVGGGKGLVVPVIRDADRLSFSQVETTLGELATRAKGNKLTMDELTGGTFTISNGGIYGSMMSTPILNPPQTGILGMHNIVDRPVAIGGELQIRPMMYLALSYDHRVVDGREAVSFLVRVKECLEAPERILLEV